MKVVLTQDVPNLGKAGEIKEVADRYVRDYLLPKGYVALATNSLIKLAQDLRKDERINMQIKQYFSLYFGLKITIMITPDRRASFKRVVVIKPVETRLLRKINQDLPSDLRQRYSDLIEKREAEALTPEEHTELLDLTDRVEQLEARRVKYLAKLARLRNATVTELIQELGIRPSAYV